MISYDKDIMYAEYDIMCYIMIGYTRYIIANIPVLAVP